MIYAFITPIMAQVAPVDPVAQFTALGVAGLVALAVYLWKLEVSKQRDEATKRAEAADARAEALANSIRELVPAINRSNEVHQESTVVSGRVIRVMEDMPSKETWRHIEALLEAQKRT